MQEILKKRNSIYFFAGVFVAMALGIWWFIFPICHTMQVVEMLDTELRLKEACSTQEKIRGLSGVSQEEFESQADAMIFRYDTQRRRTFWMNDMQYAIDIVWVRNGEVMKIETQIEAPKGDEAPLRMSSDPFAIDAVVEFPAGGVAKYGIVTGMNIPAFKP